MRKVVLFIAMSLDGYVANSDGGVEWLQGQESEGPMPDTYEKFIKTIDTVILGYKTYNQIITELSPDVWPYEGMKSYIITRRDIENSEGIEKADKPLVQLVEELKNEEGKDIWICGGASIADQLVKANLIDRYQISVIPVLLGEGVRMFSTIADTINLRLINTDITNGITELTYERR